MLNYGWRAALRHHAYDYFIFTDADVYSDTPSWFRQIRSRLQHDPSQAVQGWRTVRDTVDSTLHYSSIGAAYVLNHPTDLPLNPGICWGLHRALLEMGNGFNSYCLDCGGDSAFVVEYLNTSQRQYDPWLYQWNWFREVERELPFHAELDCVPVDLVHVHHGYLKERNYDGFRYAMDALRPLSELVHINDHGLLEWRDPECVERQNFVPAAGHGITRAKWTNCCGQFSYPRNTRPRVPKNGAASKTPFRISGYQSPRVPGKPLVHHPDKHRGLKIFDPEQVFRSDYPFSWCDGIVKAEGSTYIPIVDAEDAAVLYWTASLMLLTLFVPCRCNPHGRPWTLHGCMLCTFASGSQNLFRRMCMLAWCRNRKMAQSILLREISLKELGLHPVSRSDITIPIDRFTGNGFDPKSARLVKFVAYQSCRIELSKIYIYEDSADRQLRIPSNRSWAIHPAKKCLG